MSDNKKILEYNHAFRLVYIFYEHSLETLIASMRHTLKRFEEQPEEYSHERQVHLLSGYAEDMVQYFEDFRKTMKQSRKKQSNDFTDIATYFKRLNYYINYAKRSHNTELTFEKLPEGKYAFNDNTAFIKSTIHALIQNGLEAVDNVERERKVHVGFRDQGDTFVIWVTDTGDGFTIPFEIACGEFVTTKDEDRHQKRFGLGLWIVSEMVRLADGKLEMLRDGDITTVSITFKSAYFKQTPFKENKK